MKTHIIKTTIVVSILLTSVQLVIGQNISSAKGMSQDSPIQQILPNQKIVAFQQVDFDFEVGRIYETDWGQIQVHPKKIFQELRACSGYINVFHYTEEPNKVSWLVENLYVDAHPEEMSCLQRQNKKDKESEAISKDPFGEGGEKEALQLRPDDIPMSTYFDLRPNVDGKGIVRELQATVLFSPQPLPTHRKTMDFAKKFSPHSFKVQQVKDNAEGVLVEPSEEEESKVPQSAQPDSTPTFLVGPAPSPITPEVLPPQGGIVIPVETFQDPSPFVNTAINQCVPAAHALALGYLEQHYNGFIWKWDLPQISTRRGIGRLGAAGDVIIWEPIPSDSVVANVDALTRRQDVKDLNTGKGTSRCKSMRGIFGYIAAFGEKASVKTFRHQGGKEKYGDGETCDDGTVLLGGLTSTREGENVTWNWIFDQLKNGRSVAMVFHRYNNQGTFTSGHMVRVYGAAKYNNKDYLYTLDDSQQGNNFVGLRTQSWQVADNHSPGFSGFLHPNGRLELGNQINWEIIFAFSMEPQLTPSISLFHQ